MAIWTISAITLIVWAVMAMPSPGWQAMLYALPIPITLALIGSGSDASPAYFLGTILLAGFFYVVAILDSWLPRWVCVAVALLVYVGLGVLIDKFVTLSPPIAMTVAGSIWAAHFLIVTHLRNRSPNDDEAPSHTKTPPVAWAAVPVVTASTWLLGDAMGKLVVTFPYSGVPVALMIRGNATAFAESFGVRCGVLLLFFAGQQVTSDSLGSAGSLVAGWGCVVILLVGQAAWIAWRRPRDPAPWVGS